MIRSVTERVALDTFGQRGHQLSIIVSFVILTISEQHDRCQWILGLTAGEQIDTHFKTSADIGATRAGNVVLNRRFQRIRTEEIRLSMVMMCERETILLLLVDSFQSVRTIESSAVE